MKDAEFSLEKRRNRFVANDPHRPEKMASPLTFLSLKKSRRWEEELEGGNSGRACAGEPKGIK